MKCYFCLTEPDAQNSIYLDLLYVSLKTARQNTTLDLYVLYDGSETGRCYQILKEFDVHIIKHEFSHKNYLEKTYPQDYIKQTYGHEISYQKIAETFMRFDIPFIEQEDEYVFYSDIDVMFLKDFSHDSFPATPYVAASAEACKDLENMDYFNAGILYLNVQNMRKISEQVFAELEKGCKNTTNIFDQGYLNQFCFDKFTKMPLEFNWKPYWGYNENAYIIHMHAMKPDGNFENSGFGMSKEALINSLDKHFKDIDGYVYYLMLYYQILGKDGKKWLSEFISFLYTSGIDTYTKKNTDLEKKYIKVKKKYKFFRNLFFIALVFLILGGIFYVR